MDDTAPTADRVDVRAWANELGLPDGPLSRANTTLAFEKACAIETSYVNADNEAYRIGAREVARKDEFVTFEVTRDDGRVMAQVKFFSARKGRAGIVANTHVVKSIVRSGMNETDTEAARRWLTACDEQFRVEQGQVPWYIVRRLVRLAIEQAAVPVLRRRAMFFAYEDDLDTVFKAAVFLRRTVAQSEFIVMPVEDGAHLGLLAESADAFLDERAVRLANMVSAYLGATSRNRSRPAVKLELWTPIYEQLAREHARHERRLRSPLPQTGSTLSSTLQAMQRLSPSGRLPSVTG